MRPVIATNGLTGTIRKAKEGERQRSTPPPEPPIGRAVSIRTWLLSRKRVGRREREIGIRIAVGAQAGGIARLVTVDVFLMVLAGAFAGLALGMLSVRFLEELFYQVKATDLAMLAFPSLAILAAALLAALPAVVNAVRTDPVTMLRAE